ncbi:MAG: T9SS type A sorting domain-containing protein [Flavobacteriales bacterium]|nr:T9SS type A sorting domain-containing protein [Flavobacteriales bacterium]
MKPTVYYLKKYLVSCFLIFCFVSSKAQLNYNTTEIQLPLIGGTLNHVPVIDYQNNLWFKLSTGVLKYGEGNFQAFNHANSCLPQSFTGLNNNKGYNITTYFNNVYISAGDLGVFKIQPDCNQFTPTDMGNPDLIAGNINFSPTGTLYVSTNKGLFLYNNITGWSSINTQNSLIASDSVLNSSVVGNRLFVFHPNSISIKFGNLWQIIPTAEANSIYSVAYQSPDGYIWIKQGRKLYILYNNQLVSPALIFPYDHRRRFTECNQLTKDNNGNLWVYYDKLCFANIQTGETFYQDSQKGNYIAIGTEGKAYSIFSTKLCITDYGNYIPHVNFSSFYYMNHDTPYNNFDIGSAGLQVNIRNYSSIFGQNWNNHQSQLSLKSNPEYPLLGSSNLFIAAKKAGSNNWISVIDNYATSQRYFMPGTISIIPESHTSNVLFYNQIFDANRLDIENFKYHFQQGNIQNGSLQIHHSITNWPGNPLQGCITHAPYIDFNNDGIYNPEHGDYPDIKGDFAVWFVNNDGPLTDDSIYFSLNVENVNMIYGFENDSATGVNDLINYTLFWDLKVINRSPVTLDSLFVGNLSYGGFNEKRKMIGSCVKQHAFYFYSPDENEIINTEQQLGTRDIFESIILLNSNGQRNLSGFIYPDFSGDVETPFNHFYNLVYLSNFHSPQYYGGNGFLNPLWNQTVLSTHAMPGNSDPDFTSTQNIDPGFYWTGFNPMPGSPALDLNLSKGLGRTGPFTLLPGSEIDITWAFTTLRKNSSTSQLDFILGDLCSYPEIIQNWYDTQSFPSGLDLSTLSNEQIAENKVSIEVWPVPTDNMIQIRTSGIYGCKTIALLSIQGKTVQQMQHCSDETFQIDLSALSAGIYMVEIKDADGTSYVRKIVRK